MRKLLIYVLPLMLLAVVSCRKSDNEKIPDLTRVPYPLVVKDSSQDLAISSNPDTFAARFTVGLYYPDAEAPAKFDVVIMKNENRSTIKTLAAGVTSFPQGYDITGPQLETLFGAAIVPGDKFDIGVNITTKAGDFLEAFPALGAGYGAGVAAQPGASVSVRYSAPCPFVASEYQGTFKIITDEWEDYGEGDPIEVTLVDATHVSFKYKPDNPLPIIVAINPDNNTTSVAKQPYSTTGYAGWAYGIPSVESVASTDNYVDPCNLILSVRLKHTVAAGSFGDLTISMIKQ